MAGRIRSIKPETIEDEHAASLSDGAWRLWISTWTLADDFGCCRAGDRYLSAQVWQDTSMAKLTFAHKCLLELVGRGFLQAYEHHSQRYVKISGWEKHQRVDNAGKRRVPDISDQESVRFHVVDGALIMSCETSPLAHADAPRPPTPTTTNDPDHAAKKPPRVVLDFVAVLSRFPQRTPDPTPLPQALKWCKAHVKSQAVLDALAAAIARYALEVADRETGYIQKFSNWAKNVDLSGAAQPALPLPLSRPRPPEKPFIAPWSTPLTPEDIQAGKDAMAELRRGGL